jgi:hypothetical protein
MTDNNSNPNQLCRDQISGVLYRALESKYLSDISTAQASMLIYMNNSVGIGEHPHHIEEMDKLIDAMADAEDKLEILRKYFSNYSLSTNTQSN